MKRVIRQRQPRKFRDRVGKPGEDYLARLGRTPTTREWGNHNYWTRVLVELHTTYGGICAYSCHWIANDTGSDTVEHFLTKSSHPDKAYVWRNYRLVCGRLNGRKGTKTDVLDPFNIQDGWFLLDFPSLQVKPDPALPKSLKTKVLNTIKRLRLNDETTCIKSREKYIRNYCQGLVTYEFVQQEAPFLAFELNRQGLRATINQVMGY